MADAAIPEGFEPEPSGASAHPDVPEGFVAESPKGTDLPGSFADNPTFTQRLKRIGKAVTPAAVGTAIPIAAGYGLATAAGNPEAAPALTSGLRIAGNTIGGALAPYAEWASQKLMGENPSTPSAGDVIKSTVMNGAFTALGEGGAVATKAAQGADAEQVRSALANVQPSQRTVANVRKIRQGIRDQAATSAQEAEKVSAQDLRNRDFWKAHGLNDQQIDQVVQSPELQKQLGESIAAGGRYKQAFQDTLDHTRMTFDARYKPLLPNQSVDTSTLSEAMTKAAGGADSPKLKAWLLSESQNLQQSDSLQGLIPADQLAGMSPEERADWQAAMKNWPGGENGRTPEQLQGLRTDLRKQLSGNASNTDLQIRNQITKQLTDGIHSTQTPEQVGAFDALDQEYGRFQDVINKLDPRSEKYGAAVADAIFDPAAKDPETAMNFIRLAQNADDALGAADQGKTVMSNLREAFLNKALQETRVPGKPMDELKTLRKLQDQWGGDKNTRAVMGAMFGKDSPLADPAQFTKVVEAAAEPEKTIKLAAAGTPHNILNSPYFQGVIAFGLGAGAMGVKPGGLFQSLTGEKGPEQQMLAITSIMAGPWLIGKVIRSGNSPLQKAMVSYLTNPNAATAVRYASQLTGGLAGVMSQGGPAMPSPADVASSAVGSAPTP